MDKKLFEPHSHSEDGSEEENTSTPAANRISTVLPKPVTLSAENVLYWKQNKTDHTVCDAGGRISNALMGTQTLRHAFSV
jgi:hypothetical protein